MTKKIPELPMNKVPSNSNIYESGRQYGLLQAHKEEIRFLKEWLEMYSEGEFRTLVCERDISDRIKELEKYSQNLKTMEDKE